MTEFAYKTSLLMLSYDESQMVNPNLISFEHSEDFVLLYIQGSNEFTPFGFVGVIQPFTTTGMGLDTFKVKNEHC